jgi:hypothetical protein
MIGLVCMIEPVAGTLTGLSSDLAAGAAFVGHGVMRVM